MDVQYLDFVGNLAPVASVGFTLDTFTATPSVNVSAPITSPRTGDQAYRGRLRIGYTLPEDQLAQSVFVRLLHARNDSEALALQLSDAFPRGHTFELDSSNVSASSTVASVVGRKTTLGDGIYKVRVAYRDALGNVEATATVPTPVRIDTRTDPAVVLAPQDKQRVNAAFNISLRFPEEPLRGSARLSLRSLTQVNHSYVLYFNVTQFGAVGDVADGQVNPMLDNVTHLTVNLSDLVGGMPQVTRLERPRINTTSEQMEVIACANVSREVNTTTCVTTNATFVLVNNTVLVNQTTITFENVTVLTNETNANTTIINSTTTTTVVNGTNTTNTTLYYVRKTVQVKQTREVIIVNGTRLVKVTNTTTVCTTVTGTVVEEQCLPVNVTVERHTEVVDVLPLNESYSLLDDTYRVSLTYADFLNNSVVNDTHTAIGRSVEFSVDHVTQPFTLHAPEPVVTGTRPSMYALVVDYTLVEVAGEVLVWMQSSSSSSQVAWRESLNSSRFAVGRHTVSWTAQQLLAATNSTLVAGQSYDVYVSYKDALLNPAVTITRSGVVLDSQTLAPTMTAPLAGARYKSPLAFRYSLPEDARPGSASLTLTPVVGGGSTATAPLTFVLSSNAGAVETTIDTASPLSSPALLSGPSAAIPDGRYDWLVQYVDTATNGYASTSTAQLQVGNPAASVARANIEVDSVTLAARLLSPTAAKLTLTRPTVSYSLRETALPNSVQLTFSYNNGTMRSDWTLADSLPGEVVTFVFDPSNPCGGCVAASAPATARGVLCATCPDDQKVGDGVYTVSVSYQDSLQNARVATSLAGVYLRTSDAAVPKVTLRLAGNVSDPSVTDPETGQLLESFKQAVAEDLSRALGVPASRFRIIGVTAGSIKVTFEILPSADAADKSPDKVLEELQEQARTPNSPLLNGTITGRLLDGAAGVSTTVTCYDSSGDEIACPVEEPPTSSGLPMSLIVAGGVVVSLLLLIMLRHCFQGRVRRRATPDIRTVGGSSHHFELEDGDSAVKEFSKRMSSRDLVGLPSSSSQQNVSFQGFSEQPHRGAPVPAIVLEMTELYEEEEQQLVDTDDGGSAAAVASSAASAGTSDAPDGESDQVAGSSSSTADSNDAKAAALARQKKKQAILQQRRLKAARAKKAAAAAAAGEGSSSSSSAASTSSTGGTASAEQLAALKARKQKLLMQKKKKMLMQQRLREKQAAAAAAKKE
eukprot:TRINITY_DN65830_c11_g5_i1.p1 TRINITY_DN65830_c11_g5~~TRINITY_DN65830_c11_g5_i1.p1  ORF type:complete len:1261 (+),score=584.97 TRINITY_DN65830_c11_g5_i1:157-3783(+)